MAELDPTIPLPNGPDRGGFPPEARMLNDARHNYFGSVAASSIAPVPGVTNQAPDVYGRTPDLPLNQRDDYDYLDRAA